MPDTCPQCKQTYIYRALYYPHTTDSTMIRSHCLNIECNHKWTARLVDQVDPTRYDYDPLEE